MPLSILTKKKSKKKEDRTEKKYKKPQAREPMPDICVSFETYYFKTAKSP